MNGGGGNMLQENLRSLRKEKKLTQADISKRLGIPRTTYAGYENGSRNPDPETLQLLADFHDVSVDYLLGRDEKLPVETIDWSKLDPEHAERAKILIEMFESASPEGKEAMIQNMEMILKLDKSKNRS